MFSSSTPVIIAGPCSAENLDMVMATARELKKVGVNIFRAGIWKPRTHPDSFEGVGERGFEWLSQVQKECGMRTATEVANAQHVEIALKHGVDILWLGARTTTNPFITSEIAESLRGVSIPVLVKNPINPEIELWIGAVERLQHAGISEIGLVHRGFSTYETLRYRNAPYWQIPIEMRRRLPDIPLLCDPSHISGDRSFVKEISDKAMSLGFRGLMIECHISPDKALSDAQQQITPSELKHIIATLNIKKEDIEDQELLTTIEELRAQIDRLDLSMVDILSERMSVVDKIGKLKSLSNISPLQPNRWNKVLQKVRIAAKEKGLNPDYVESLFQIIHQASIERQY